MQKTSQPAKAISTQRLWFSQRGLWRSPDAGGAPAPASPEGETTPPPATSPTPGAQGGKPGFSEEQQAQIDRLAGNARKEGKQSGVKELLEELGVTDLDALRGVVSTTRQKEEAEKSELQKTVERLQRLEQKTTEQLSKAGSLLVKAKTEALAARHGLDPEKVGAFLATFGGFSNFKVDWETGEVEGLDETFKNLKALIGTPDPAALEQPNGQQRDRSFVRQGAGGQPEKPNAARSYMSQTYGDKK